jgi:hypothetical protein
MFPLTPLEAKFADSLQSEGPHPPAGTAASPHSPFKSGLDADCQYVYGEDQAEFPVLQREYFDRFQPYTPEERFQVDSLIRSEWSIRRLFRVEAHLWEYHAMLSDRSSGVPLGEGFTRASEVFMRLQRRVNASERTYKEAYKELGRLQATRTSAPAFASAQPHQQQPSGAGASACQPQMPPQPDPQPPAPDARPDTADAPSAPPRAATAAAAASTAAPASVTPEPQPGPRTATNGHPEGRAADRPLPPRPDPASLARRTRPQASQ